MRCRDGDVVGVFPTQFYEEWLDRETLLEVEARVEVMRMCFVFMYVTCIACVHAD